MSKHTPGPWRAYCLGSEGYQVRRDNTGLPATKVKEELRARLTPVCAILSGSWELQKGDAHLIAASPKLLKACENALALVMIQGADQPVLYESEGFRWLKSQLEEAIAQATKEAT